MSKPRRLQQQNRFVQRNSLMRNDNIFTLLDGEPDMMATAHIPRFSKQGRRQVDASFEKLKRSQGRKNKRPRSLQPKKVHTSPNATIDYATNSDVEIVSSAPRVHPKNRLNDDGVADDSDDDFQSTAALPSRPNPKQSRKRSPEMSLPMQSPGKKARAKISVLSISPDASPTSNKPSEPKSRLSLSGPAPKLNVRIVSAKPSKKPSEPSASKRKTRARTSMSNEKDHIEVVVLDEDDADDADGNVSESKPPSRGAQMVAVPLRIFEPDGGYRAGEPKSNIVKRQLPSKDKPKSRMGSLQTKAKKGEPTRRDPKLRIVPKSSTASNAGANLARRVGPNDREICEKRVRRMDTNLEPSDAITARNKVHDMRAPISNRFEKPRRTRYEDDEDFEPEMLLTGRTRRFLRNGATQKQLSDRFEKAIRDSAAADSDDETELEKNERFCKLDDGEQAWYDSNTKGKKSQPVKVHAANITLHLRDLKTLRARRWLNDEIINSFGALLNCRNRDFFRNKELGVQQNSAEGQNRPRTHMFSSFFFTRLTSGGYDYDGVRRWPKRAGVDVKSLDLILFPINLHNTHWVLAAVHIRGRRFLYLDSLGGSDRHNVLGVLRRWLIDEVEAKNGPEEANAMDIMSWAFVENPDNMPKQLDGSSCGVFVLYNADYLELGQEFGFQQKDIEVLRKRTAIFLKKNRLADHPDAQ